MKKFLVLISVLLLLLSLCACSTDAREAKYQIIALCEKRGLSDVSVTISPYQKSGNYKVCNVNVSCSDFDSLDFDMMYLLFYNIDSLHISGSNLIWTYYGISISSGGHTYTFKEGSSKTGESGYVYCDNKELYEVQYTVSTAKGSNESGSTSSDSGARHSDSEAWACTQDIVEGNLKSPSTAKFCKVTDATITHDGDKYTVKGWVDAANSFGATVRTNFTVEYTATAKGYKSASVTFD